MIYIFKDQGGYQKFPEPDGSKPFFPVSGNDETRILAGDPYRINDTLDGVIFPPMAEVEAEAAAAALQAEREAMRPSRLQTRLAMIELGALDGVEAVVAQADQITQEAWTGAQYFRRLSPLVLSMIQALGWTDEFTDDLCRLALTKEP